MQDKHSDERPHTRLVSTRSGLPIRKDGAGGGHSKAVLQNATLRDLEASTLLQAQHQEHMRCLFITDPSQVAAPIHVRCVSPHLRVTHCFPFIIWSRVCSVKLRSAAHLAI